jgi:hypothetical protein
MAEKSGMEKEQEAGKGPKTVKMTRDAFETLMDKALPGEAYQLTPEEMAAEDSEWTDIEIVDPPKPSKPKQK